MADILLDVQSAPSTPSAGQAVVFVDTTTKNLHTRNDAGVHRGYVYNQSTTSQSPAAATLTYITNSNLAIPTNKLQIGTCFRWTLSVTKTGAGAATATFNIRVGTAGTTADAAVITFTKKAGTAAADEGTIVISAVVRSIGAAGVMVGQFSMTHNLATTGHLTTGSESLNVVSAGFDMTVVNLIAGISVTSAASELYTFQLVQAEAWNL